MEELYVKLRERNRRETLPLLPIYTSYTALLQLSDDLQRRLQEADQEILLLRLNNEEPQSENWNAGKSGQGGTGTPSSSTVSSAAAAAASQQSKTLTVALRNETRLRDKLEHLEEAYDAKMKSETSIRAEATALTAKLREMEGLVVSQKATIQELSAKVERLLQKSTKLVEQSEESELNRSLAEQQNEGLKHTIRTLQEDNQVLKRENALFGDRLITDKEKMVNELNQLNEVIGRLEKENQELRAMERQNQEERKKVAAAKSSAWFGVFGGGGGGESSSSSLPPASPTREDDNNSDNNNKATPTPQSPSKEQSQPFVVCPSTAHKTIPAHTNEGTCLRFDRHDSTIFATASIGGSVKTWNATTGASCSVFYCMPGQAILSCDVSRSIVAGAGTDKTCRVWDTMTNRMIHQLAGHLHKVTSVRILNNNQHVLTCSADRSMKLWDISKQTYRQSTTMSFNSFASSIDVVSDGRSAISGHVDGSLLFWDLEKAQKTAEIKGIQQGGITSVCIDPREKTRVLTNCLASALHIIDVRAGKAIRTLRHDDFSTNHGHAGCTISPNGQFVAAGSDNGEVFVWDVAKGELKTRLASGGGGVSPVIGIDWRESRDKESPQIATLDRKGAVVLWA